MQKLPIYNTLIILLVMLLPLGSNAQPLTKIMGTVIDVSTKDPIPFVNIYFPNSGISTTTDFDGKYSIETKIAKDSLYAQYMGYKVETRKVVKNKFQMIDFELKPLSFELSEVVILPGLNPAEIILKKVIANKHLNNREEYDAFHYEAYSKVQVDANNYSEKFTTSALMKPFSFVFENADTSTINGKVYLPVFFTETLSDIYFRKQPKSYHEVIKASKASGMDKSNLAQLVGDSYQKVNIYDNYNMLFDKNFVSPIANFGLAYYKYYLIDSLFIDGDWCYHIKFKPRRNQELTYTGNIWIHDTTFGVVKVDMRVVKDANINIINEITIVQEFKQVDHKYWMPTVDNMIADLNIVENTSKVIGMYLHKTTSYKNFEVNKLLTDKFYKKPSNIIVKDSALNRDNDYWENYRHDSLTVQERKILKMVDTVKSLKAYKVYSNLFFAVSTNHIKLGYLEYGPILSTYSYNPVEGHRIRMGLRTSNKFSKKLMISVFGAYGTKDEEFKYRTFVRYLFRKNPNTGFRISYTKDIEQLGMSVNALPNDFIFRSLLSRSGSGQLAMCRTFETTIEKEWFIGLSNNFYFRNRIIFPINNSPFYLLRENDVIVAKSELTLTEIQLNTRFAYNEKYISGEFTRLSLGTKYPALGVSYVYGMKNILNSDYVYHKLDLTLTHWFNVSTIGWSRYIFNVGKVWGTLPYPLLKIHEGNQTFFFDQTAFNTMNYIEFVSDQYLSVSYTHHFDGLFFNHVPLFKKLRWREVVFYKGVIGSLSSSNLNYNVDLSSFNTLKKGPFQEVGAGIENIFKVIKIVGVWRLNYLDHPDIRKFMIMFSLDFKF